MKKKKNSVLAIYWRTVRSDYRHIICLVLIVASVGFGFLFPNGLPRLAESFRDLGVSVAYYFCELFSSRNRVRPTVTKLPTWKWTEERWEPLRLFPWTWEEFQSKCEIYFEHLFSKREFSRVS